MPQPTPGRYTVVYEGDPSGVKILSGETPPGKAIGVHAGDLIADAARSEKHRNDLMDSIVALRTDRGALRARVEALEELARVYLATPEPSPTSERI